MFEVISVAVFCLLFFPALRLCFKLAWGAAKVVAVVLFLLAITSLVGCLLMAGGVLLLLPVGLVALALGILRACF